MIKSENGCVQISGNPVTNMSDLSCAVKGLVDHLTKTEGEERATRLVKGAIEVAFMTDEEVEAKSREALKEFERGLTATLAKAMLFDD